MLRRKEISSNGDRKGEMGINQGEDKSLSVSNALENQDLAKKVKGKGKDRRAKGGRREAQGRNMTQEKTDGGVICFGAFEVNLESRELRKKGLRLRVEEKPFQILEMLLEKAGQVVQRKALFERLWPDTHVGFEHGLNTAMNKLRALLGDSAQSQRFVETLPRRGYRFIAPVTKPDSNAHAFLGPERIEIRQPAELGEINAPSAD
jgi:DNA-binding winged helix-turn-helix (wHTH) protein